MARPEGTYTRQVFNFGIEDNIPFGFVDVVFDRAGNAVGFEKDGVFYNLGEQVPTDRIQKPLTAKQLATKVDILTKKLNNLKRTASNTNISDAERNKAIEDFKATEDELVRIKKSAVEAEVSEGKIKEEQASKKAADAIRFEIRTLKERRQLLSKLGQTTTEVDNQIRDKERSLKGIITPTRARTAPGPTVPVANRPFGGMSVSGQPITTATTAAPVATPQAGATGGGGAGGGAGGAGGAGGGAGGDKGKGEKPKTKEERYADAIALAIEKYNMPDIIFKNVGSLKTLLEKFVNNELTDEQFKREIELDPWYRSNSAEIKARYVQLFNYEDLVTQGRATGTTDYEQKINKIVRNIQAKARELNGVEIPDDQAKLMAKDLYIYNLDNDPAVLTERLVRFIRPSAGMIGGVPTTGYGGQALQNYQALQAVAKANGMRIEDLLPRDAMGNPMTAEGTLEQLALGKIDINRIAQDARKLAALGQPDFVKDLLGQGYDLETIYSPYRNTMANILELDPNTISLSDAGLRMGISKEGDMNLYDYERALRNDGRWQYTQQARGEVADVALRVLRDFGFTG
jgi:hypothetical protein